MLIMSLAAVQSHSSVAGEDLIMGVDLWFKICFWLRSHLFQFYQSILISRHWQSLWVLGRGMRRKLMLDLMHAEVIHGSLNIEIVVSREMLLQARCFWMSSESVDIGLVAAYVVCFIKKFWVFFITVSYMGHAVALWLRHYPTNRQVAGSIPDDVRIFFKWHNPAGRTMDLGSTQPLTEMTTRCILGVKAAGA
jgi:hypothetical protein